MADVGRPTVGGKGNHHALDRGEEPSQVVAVVGRPFEIGHVSPVALGEPLGKAFPFLVEQGKRDGACG